MIGECAGVGIATWIGSGCAGDVVLRTCGGRGGSNGALYCGRSDRTAGFFVAYLHVIRLHLGSFRLIFFELAFPAAQNVRTHIDRSAYKRGVA